MKPTVVCVLPREAFSPDIILKLTEAADVKFGPYDKVRFLQDVADATAIILDQYPGCMVLDEEVLRAAHKLKGVSIHGAGYDIIDVEACTLRKIYVANAPVLAAAVADLVVAFMLCLSRNVLKADSFVRNEWATATQPFPLGKELYMKTLGIIGLGRIGFNVAKRAYAFDMKILYNDLIRNREAEKSFNAQSVTLEELLRQSDFVSVNVPLTDENRLMIGEKELSLMKRTAYLINTSRGSVVDQKALTKALHENRIAGAGLDVFSTEPASVNDPILQFDSVVLTPHIGGVTVERVRRVDVTAVDNVLSILRGERPDNVVVEQKGLTF
ncbi:MAG TPA: NAD(P)-dependent oxidoreductase [Candidatus Bathyarchaeia archaeon]|nr:NAD(P)-dependent oxidoreductase [Candidatus Bathyarchaeia archaeon]